MLSEEGPLLSFYSLTGCKITIIINKNSSFLEHESWIWTEVPMRMGEQQFGGVG